MPRPYTTVVTLVGLLILCTPYLTLVAQDRERFTDLRDQVYSVEDLERALFPDAAPQIRTRGLEPQPRPQLPPATKISVALNVFFEFNSDRILSRYYTDLDMLGTVLERHAGQYYYIEGHTDSVGSDAYNQRLSERRAQSVRRYLVSHFTIPPERLVARGYGESQPRTTNENDQGRKINRRVEVVRK